MEEMALWEQILLAGVALALVVLMRPSIKAAFERSKDAPKDWAGLLVPIGAVVLFVIFLISMV